MNGDTSFLCLILELHRKRGRSSINPSHGPSFLRFLPVTDKLYKLMATNYHRSFSFLLLYHRENLASFCIGISLENGVLKD